MFKRISPIVLILIASFAQAEPLKVHLLPNDDRKAYLTPHWDNWKFKDAKTAQQKFGDVTVTLTGGGNASLTTIALKALIENGMHMGLTGVTTARAPGGQIIMSITGLSPGPHTLATYHNDFRPRTSSDYEITVDGRVVEAKFSPTHDARSDYDVASTYIRINAVAGKPVEIAFRPLDSSGSVVINGFEIDCSDPRKKAIKPIPANDDEHVDRQSSLAWTAPPSAKTHLLYFGDDEQAVANANQQSPEFKGALHDTQFPVPPMNNMGTHFWRVDEVNDDPNSPPVKGEIWRIRERSLAFPTAEGYGRFARGGRGGRVIEVTNLEDYAENEPPIPGSYRAAVEATGPRTVIFRVSGLIQLKRECAIRNPYITIAGQTAPGDGICLANYAAGLATSDAIVRFLRVRVGDKSRRAMDGLGLGDSDNSIIDHCSISWAMDEGTSSRGGHGITFQWNIISEGLNHAYHYRAADRTQFEGHAFAGSISGDIGSYHHNLLAHNTDRNWSLAGGYDQAVNYAGYLDIRNNVVYNWTARTTDGGVMQLNYVDNYYKPYTKNRFVTWLLKLDPVISSHGTPKYFMQGNVMEGFNYDNDNWQAFFNGPQLEQLVRVDKPLFPSYVKPETARQAYPRVLAGAGAILPRRDVIDARIVEEVRTGTVHYEGTKGSTSNPPGRDFPGIIDTQDDVHDADDSPVKPWPNYKTYNVPVESDHDGIPDDWKLAHGLKLHDPTVANADYNGDGYTNLEKYLNSLTGEYDDKPTPQN